MGECLLETWEYFLKHNNSFLLRKYKKSVWGFCFLKYKKLSWGEFFYSLSFGWKVQGFLFGKEKVFITRKCTPCITELTKTHLTPSKNSNYLIITKLESVFKNKNCFSWIKLISFLIHFKYWYYNTSSLELPCLRFHLFQILPWSTETSRQQNHHHAFHWYAPIIGYTKLYALSNQSNLLSNHMHTITPYWSSKLPIKNLGRL